MRSRRSTVSIAVQLLLASRFTNAAAPALDVKPELNLPRVRGHDETNDAVGQAFADAVAGGTGMFRTDPDGSTEHISPDQFKLAPPAKEKA